MPSDFVACAQTVFICSEIKRQKSCFCSRRTRKAARNDTNTRKRKKMRWEQETKKKRRRNLQGPRKQELWMISRPSWRVETGQETVRAETMKNSNQSGFDIHTMWHRQVIFQSIPHVFQCLTFRIFTAFLFFQHCSFIKWYVAPLFTSWRFPVFSDMSLLDAFFKWSRVYSVINWLELIKL